MIDMHNHILYGIDDGCKTIEESIETIKNMKTGSNTAFSELIKNYKFKNSNGRNVNPSKDMFTSWI